MTALALLPGIREYIISQVSQGLRLSDLGLGITPQSISQALRDDPDYIEAQEHYHAARLDAAEDMLLLADPTDVPRARAVHDAYRWRASREHKKWADKQPEITINTGVPMDAALGQSALSLLDRMRTVSIQDQQVEQDRQDRQDRQDQQVEQDRQDQQGGHSPALSVAAGR